MNDDDWHSDYVFVKKDGKLKIQPQIDRVQEHGIDKRLVGSQVKRQNLIGIHNMSSSRPRNRAIQIDDACDGSNLWNTGWNDYRGNKSRNRQTKNSKVREDSFELDIADPYAENKFNTYQRFDKHEDVSKGLSGGYYKNLSFTINNSKKEWAALPPLPTLNTPKVSKDQTTNSLPQSISISKFKPLIPITPVRIPKPKFHKKSIDESTEESTIFAKPANKLNLKPKSISHQRLDGQKTPINTQVPVQPFISEERSHQIASKKKPRPQTASTRPASKCQTKKAEYAKASNKSSICDKSNRLDAQIDVGKTKKTVKILWFNSSKRSPQYQIEEMLGSGAFGEVYSALDLSTDDKRVAIKVFCKRGLTSHDRKAIDKEVEIMSILQHEHIVTLDGIFYDTDKVGLVMPMLKGRTVIGAVRSKLVTENLANSWSLCLLKAISYMHSNGIYHRDIKAENVIVYKNKATLIDFGLSIDKDDYLTSKCGTMSYMAPELITGKIYKPGPNDIWCFGVLYYYMLTGTYPFGSRL